MYLSTLSYSIPDTFKIPRNDEYIGPTTEYVIFQRIMNKNFIFF